MQSTLEYLEVSQGVSEYLGDLDFANKRRLTRRWVWVWIIESYSVWGNVWSVVEMECVRSLETGIFCQRGWNLGVSPNNQGSLSVKWETPWMVVYTVILPNIAMLWLSSAEHWHSLANSKRQSQPHHACSSQSCGIEVNTMVRHYCWAAITTLGSMPAYALKLTLLV